MNIRFLRRHRGRLAIAAAAAVLPLTLLGVGTATAGTTTTGTTTTGAATTGNAQHAIKLPPIKHVWVIELENEGYPQTFGDPAADPYLAKTCCGETLGKSASHPNVAKPGMNGPGGGRVGAVLLSPFIKPGTVSTVDYNHYSMLRSFEDLFGLSHLGDAAMPQVKSFGPDVYTRP